VPARRNRKRPITATKRSAANWGNGPGCPSLVLMTTRPERFRVKALECYAAAQKTKDPQTREAYLELVRNWRDLAEEIERFEHAWLDREGI
jgi:hypothetical protein